MCGNLKQCAASMRLGRKHTPLSPIQNSTRFLMLCSLYHQNGKNLKFRELTLFFSVQKWMFLWNECIKVMDHPEAGTLHIKPPFICAKPNTGEKTLFSRVSRIIRLPFNHCLSILVKTIFILFIVFSPLKGKVSLFPPMLKWLYFFFKSIITYWRYK